MVAWGRIMPSQWGKVGRSGETIAAVVRCPPGQPQQAEPPEVSTRPTPENVPTRDDPNPSGSFAPPDNPLLPVPMTGTA